jgi:hypothetical protein
MFYNLLDKMTHVWLYPLLRFARSAAFTLIVPITSASVAALGAHVLSRRVPYYVYDLAFRHWPVARPEAMRAIMFVKLSLLTVGSFDLSVLFTCRALTLRPGNVFRARRDVYAGSNSAGRLERSSRHATTQRRDRDPASPCETAG